jgi:RNA polymerase sigma factor (sigma-70 family)
MMSDGELLRRYAETSSEEAFAELVRRHIDLVYSAALRQVNGDAHLAQDVSQKVFSELARRASSLWKRPVLSGWFYTCAHFIATKAVRTECRRRKREQEAQAMHELSDAGASEIDWGKIRPVVDRVMHELNASDREVILMRYFENPQLADIGQRLGLNGDAARKRVDRALDKLRTFLARRGITTTAALATVLSANAVQVAPIGLASTLTTASLAGVATATGTTVTLLKIATMTKLQLSAISALVIAGVATPLVIQHQAQASLRQQNRALLEQNAQLAADGDRFSNELAQAKSAQTSANEQLNELLKLRGEVGSLRRQTNDLAKLQAENQQLRSSLAATGARPKVAAQRTPPQDSVPKESWAFVGYADPESAFQSTAWAMSQGDVKAYRASLSPGGSEFKHAQGKSEEELAARAKAEMEKVTAFKIIDKEAISDDEVLLAVYASGINESAKFRLQRIGNEWKMAGPVK